MSPAITRDALAAHLEGQADWRRRKADEFPEDHRNLEWARRLEELARWVRTLSPRHPGLIRLDKVWGFYGLDLFGVSGPRSSELTSRPDTQGEDWLEAFIEAYVEEEAEAGADVDPSLLLEWIQDPDPAIALPAVRRLQYQLEEWEEEAVLKAQVEDMPWSRIGQLLGRSRQSVWVKHRDPGEEGLAS
jgi:hypothetical protein